MVFGGDQGTVFSQVEKMLAAIAIETNPEKKASLDQPKKSIARNTSWI
jgi:hypothetical protein